MTTVIDRPGIKTEPQVRHLQSILEHARGYSHKFIRFDDEADVIIGDDRHVGHIALKSVLVTEQGTRYALIERKATDGTPLVDLAILQPRFRAVLKLTIVSPAEFYEGLLNEPCDQQMVVVKLAILVAPK